MLLGENMAKDCIYQEFKKIIAKLPNSIANKKNQAEIKELLYSYVLNNPSSAGPENAKKFTDYQITTPQRYKKVIGAIKEIVGNDEDYIYLKDKKIDNDILNIFESSCQHKEIIIFKTNNVGQLDSLFARLRNAFAHGNIRKYKQNYILWNENNKVLSLLCILSYASLIKILNAVTNYA